MFPIILLSLKERPPRTTSTQLINHTFTLRCRDTKNSHANGSPPTFQRIWVTRFREWVSLVTAGRTTMNSNHVAKQKVTQLSRSQLDADFSEIKKNFRWRRQMASADANFVASQHRSVPPVHPTHFTRISVPYVGRHTPPQLSPSEEGHENSTRDGGTCLQGKRNCVGIIIGLMRNRTYQFQALHHTIKRSV